MTSQLACGVPDGAGGLHDTSSCSRALLQLELGPTVGSISYLGPQQDARCGRHGREFDPCDSP